MLSLKGDDYLGLVFVPKQEIETNLKLNEELLFYEDVSEGTGKLSFSLTFSEEKIQKKINIKEAQLLKSK